MNVKVTGYDKDLVNVVIPSEVTYNSKTYQIKQIDEKGLFCSTSSSSKMQTLVIFEGVEVLGSQGNKQLKTVELSSSLTSIGEKAFDGLTTLETVRFPNGSKLQTISKYAFNGCKKLETLQFYPDGTTITNVQPTFPETVVTIGEYAFNSVPAFKALILHGGLTTISNYSFARCDNLEYIWLKEGITRIGDSSFYDCPSLSYVVLPSTLSNVYSGAFTCSYQNGKTTRTINRTYILLGDEPFKYSARAQTDFYGLWLPANIDAIAGERLFCERHNCRIYPDNRGLYWHFKVADYPAYTLPTEISRAYLNHEISIRDVYVHWHRDGRSTI